MVYMAFGPKGRERTLVCHAVLKLSICFSELDFQVAQKAKYEVDKYFLSVDSIAWKTNMNLRSKRDIQKNHGKYV